LLFSVLWLWVSVHLSQGRSHAFEVIRAKSLSIDSRTLIGIPLIQGSRRGGEAVFNSFGQSAVHRAADPFGDLGNGHRDEVLSISDRKTSVSLNGLDGKGTTGSHCNHLPRPERIRYTHESPLAITLGRLRGPARGEPIRTWIENLGAYRSGPSSGDDGSFAFPTHEPGSLHPLGQVTRLKGADSIWGEDRMGGDMRVRVAD